VSRSTRVRVGAVGYLNARPLVYGLERLDRFAVRYDVPSQCARLLHDDAIDIGLIPSIEYLRGGPYAIVPGLAIASRGPVASVMLYATRPIEQVRSIAMDTSSRTSVALARVLCARLFEIQPAIDARGPDLSDMLSRCDAALIIGDNALFLDPRSVRLKPETTTSVSLKPDTTVNAVRLKPDTTLSSVGVSRGTYMDSVRLTDIATGAVLSHPGGETQLTVIDLGDAWTRMTGLPFVYAFWAGRPGVLTGQDVAALKRARDEGIRWPDELAREYLADRPALQALGADYLRDKIKYHFSDDERAGLEAFYRYSVEAGVVPAAQELRFFEEQT
jgi:predicted solute-binding protein